MMKNLTIYPEKSYNSDNTRRLLPVIERQQYELLDIIKYVSSLFIVLHHYQQIFGIRFNRINFYDIAWIDNRSFAVGYLVELFFMISGFLTSCSSYRHDNMYQSLKSSFQSWRHKAERVYPMAFLACLTYLLLAHVHRFLLGSWPDQICEYTDLKTIICSSLLIFSGIPGLFMRGINNPAWYLCVLMICQTLFCLVRYIATINRINPNYLFLVLLMISIIGPHISEIEFLYDGNSVRGYDCFFIGVLLGEVLPSLFWGNRKDMCILFDIFMIILITYSLHSRFQIIVVVYQRLLCVCIIYPLIIINAVAFREIRFRLFPLLGRLSFEIYLWHCPCFVILRIVFAMMGREISDSFGVAILVLLFINIFAYLSFVLLEKPIMNFIRLKNGAY